MNPNYIALVRKQKDSEYSVEFPDFPGCVTAGETLEEADAMAREVLQFHIDGLAKDSQEIPEPSSLEEVMSNPDHRDAIPFLVSVRARQGKPVRVTVTFDEYLVGDMDSLAASRGVSRSALLAEAFRVLEAIETAPGVPRKLSHATRAVVHKLPRRRQRAK